MATFVLVAGACCGGWSWKRVTPLLRAAGHEVYTPTLTGLGERVHLGHPDIDLDTHITDIVNVLEFEDLQDVTLVGWSYGGMVITGVADRAPERMTQLVYLDATAPLDGQNLYDCWPDSEAWRAEDEARAGAIGEGWRHYYADDALDVLGTDLTAEDRDWFLGKRTGQPLKTLTQPLKLRRKAGTALPRAYIYCAQGWDPAEPEPAFLARARTEPDWRYLPLAASHIAPVSAPRETADLLLSLLEATGQQQAQPR
jgi:pimeloyl-ACP methyl ester carboxylesterase